MHGITPEDRGLVGYVQDLGHTWHGFPNYIELDGPLTYDDCKKTIDYNVVKIPLAYHVPPELASVANLHGIVPQSNPEKDGTTGPLMFALVREDTGNQVFEISVGSDFTIYQNREFLDKINEALIEPNPQIVLESVGTLFAGRIAFINVILDKFRVGKDPSPSITRIMCFNAFGGRSITACMHHVRIVCNNTLMMAEAQGALNDTLKKFRHTSGAPDKVKKHMFDLAKLQEINESRKKLMDRLADIQMPAKDVENFLGNLIEIPEDAGPSTKTGRQNKRDEIETIFAEAADLQGPIAQTRYSMLQAVTQYSQHHTIPENSVEVDEAYAWFDVSTGGVRDKMNQQAFTLLSKDEIPEPKKSAKTPALN